MSQLEHKTSTEELVGEFRKLVGLGFSAAREQIGRVSARVKQEFDPNERLDRALRAKYDMMRASGMDALTIEEALAAIVRRKVGEFARDSQTADKSGEA